MPNFSWLMPEEINPSARKTGARAVPATQQCWEAKWPETDGLRSPQTDYWKRLVGQVSTEHKGTAKLSSEDAISSKEIDPQRLKLDPASWIPPTWLTWVRKPNQNKPPTKERNQTKTKTLSFLALLQHFTQGNGCKLQTEDDF